MRAGRWQPCDWRLRPGGCREPIRPAAGRSRARRLLRRPCPRESERRHGRRAADRAPGSELAASCWGSRRNVRQPAQVGAQAAGSLELLNLFDPEIAITQEFALGEAAPRECVAQLADPAFHGPGRPIVRKRLLELAAVDAIAPGIRTDSIRVAHAASRHERLHEIGEVANAVILARAADVEGLI